MSEEDPLPPIIPPHYPYVEGGCRPLLLLLGVEKGHGEQAPYPPMCLLVDLVHGCPWLLSRRVRSCSCGLLHLGEQRDKG